MIVFCHDQIIQARKHRAIGMRLWHQYPHHVHRFEWLLTTLNSNVSYPLHFMDAVRQCADRKGKGIDYAEDLQAKTRDLKAYEKVREDFWSDPETTRAERSDVSNMELLATAWEMKRRGWNRQSHPKEMAEFLEAVGEYYKEYHTPDNNNRTRLLSDIISNYKGYGLSGDELVAFFEPFLNYRSEELQSMARSAQSMVALAQEPLALQAQTLSGSKVDLADYRGKIVLVDHWVTTCSACIHAMARLHDVYLRYKDKGFEVLSVCYDGKAQREKVLRIEKEMGLTWITVAADGMWDAMSQRYGYQGVPQYMLLNRDGTLHAGTAEVDMGRGLQPLLDEMLVAEAAAKKME